MGRCYRYAEERGPKPPEIEAGELVDRFGAQAVYGRTMTRGEMRAILLAETVTRAYRARAEAKEMAAWVSDHPELQSLLVRAMRAADGKR